MKEIISNKKVITDAVSLDQNLVVFNNIKVTHNTSEDFLDVSIDILERKDIETVVDVGNDVEETVTESKFRKIKTITDKYSKELAGQLIESKISSLPENLNRIEEDQILYLEIAKDIVSNNGYLGLKTADLEIV